MRQCLAEALRRQEVRRDNIVRHRAGLRTILEQRRGNAGMDMATSLPEQALVGCIANQRVLESIECLGWVAAAENQLGRSQPAKSDDKHWLGPVSNRGQQGVVEFTADAG